MTKVRSIDTLTIDSTVLCCNFVNTVYAWRGENLHEYLGTYADFLAWCDKLDVINKAQIKALRTLAEAHPQKAVTALTQIKEIRDLLYRFISAIAEGEQEKYQALLKKVNPLIADAFAHTSLTFKDDKFSTMFNEQSADLMSPIWLILKSLADMLTQEPLNRVKECPTCGWVFLDETKNGRRRWCNPSDCGTQDKMIRYTNKKKSNPKT